MILNPRSELGDLGFSMGGANPQTKFHSLDLVQSVDLLDTQFCNKSVKVLYTNPTGLNETTELMRGRIQEFLTFRCEKTSDEVLGFEFVESEEEMVRAYNNYRAAVEAESSDKTNLTSIVAGLVFKEFLQQGDFSYDIRLGVETWELESRTKEIK